MQTMTDATTAPQARGQIKSRKRVVDHGEVFTHPREVNAMLDLVKPESERIDSRFLEPACGDGNFLIEILRRKLAVCRRRAEAEQYTQLQYEQNAVLAVSSLYGIELLADNVAACRERLASFFAAQYADVYGPRCKAECTASVQYLLEKNIIHGDALSYRRVDNPEQWIVVSEWSMIGQGMVNRRDYEFSYLVGDSAEADLFSDLPCAVFPPVYFLNLNRQSYGEE